MNGSSCPNVFTFNEQYFRSAYPEFGDAKVYTTAQLQRWWFWTTTYMSPVNRCTFLISGLEGPTLFNGLNLMLAHFAEIERLGAAGQVPGIITEADIDKVSVTLEPPPLPDQFQWWLGTTRYGQSLLALLQICSVGGFYIPAGSPVLSAFTNP